jgi:prevent-host-death family protein
MDSDLEISNARVYTMRELNQHTADVLREVNESGLPAPITRHGRFVALLVPLANTDVESAVLSTVLRTAEQYGQLVGQSTASATYTEDEIAQDLGVKLPPK